MHPGRCERCSLPENMALQASSLCPPPCRLAGRLAAFHAAVCACPHPGQLQQAPSEGATSEATAEQHCYSGQSMRARQVIVASCAAVLEYGTLVVLSDVMLPLLHVHQMDSVSQLQSQHYHNHWSSSSRTDEDEIR